MCLEPRARGLDDLAANDPYVIGEFCLLIGEEIVLMVLHVGRRRRKHNPKGFVARYRALVDDAASILIKTVGR
jgi:hypothetical protein